MNTFRRKNLRNIQIIFETRTGVTLPRSAAAHPTIRMALLFAVLLLSLSVTAYAYREFTALSGDELSLTAAYVGGGVVNITVENRSDKALRFQPQLKLLRWSTGEEAIQTGDILMTNREYAPHSQGIMTIDLSKAYNMALLEEPIGDWYYFVLTNGGFLFGQDWICSVNFSLPISPAPQSTAISEPSVFQITPSEEGRGPEEKLAWYFEGNGGPELRDSKNGAYIQQVRELLAGQEERVVSSVSPALVLEDPAEDAVFDPGFTDEPQRVLTGLHVHPVDWDFRLLAAEGESAQILSVMLPLRDYPDTFRELPILYYFMYEKAAVAEEACVFLYGQVLSFRELEDCKVWENDDYICYEVHSLIYSDLEAHTKQWLQANPEVMFDDALRQRVRNVYDYYSANVRFRPVETE